LRHISE